MVKSERDGEIEVQGKTKLSQIFWHEYKKFCPKTWNCSRAGESDSWTSMFWPRTGFDDVTIFLFLEHDLYMHRVRRVALPDNERRNIVKNLKKKKLLVTQLKGRWQTCKRKMLGSMSNYGEHEIIEWGELKTMKKKATWHLWIFIHTCYIFMFYVFRKINPKLE